MNQVEMVLPFRAQREERSLLRRIHEMEEQLRRFIGVEYCVVVPNAVTGLRLSLKAAGICKNDRVLCTTFAQYSTMQTIMELGALPEFVDVNPNTYNMDPYCLEYVIGKSLRTRGEVPKALITVDLFGLPCHYAAIEAICEKYEILLIEDMTQAFGASCYGKKAGRFGRFAVASFRETKLPGSSEDDGMIFCHTREDEETLRGLLGESPLALPGADREESADAAGMHVSVMIEQLRQYRNELERRQKVARRYRDRLGAAVKTQRISDQHESAFTQFVVALQDNEMRAFVMDRLLEEQIPCSIFYPVPLHQRREHSGGERVILANAERISQKLLVLPMHSYLTNHVIDYICDQLLHAIDCYTSAVTVRNTE